MSFRSPLPRPKNCDDKYQHRYTQKCDPKRRPYRWSKSK
jgi:hypothetical protein